MNADILTWTDCDWPSLLDAARAGVEEALGEVFERLNSYCRMLSGSLLSVDLVPKIGASDIAQRSLLEAFAEFRKFDGQTEAELRAWLSTIVNHNVIDAARHYRTAGRRTQTREVRLDAREHAATIAGPVQPPSLALRRQEADVELYRAVARLPENQRLVVELRYRSGLDYRQIAAAMEISEVAARKHCSRAIEALRKQLAGVDATGF
jgi:RNA polymerase sigma-70 factor, ECF subfamily